MIGRSLWVSCDAPACDEEIVLMGAEANVRQVRKALADRPTAVSVDPPWESVRRAARYILTGETT